MPNMSHRQGTADFSSTRSDSPVPTIASQGSFLSSGSGQAQPETGQPRRIDYADGDLLGELLAHPRDSPSISQAQDYARHLRLGGPAKPNVAAKPYNGFQWNVSTHTLANLTRFPRRRIHSGTSYDWIGDQDWLLPQYFWDSERGETVPATDAIFDSGYVAVSWTWGRYQLRDARGVPKTRWTHGTRNWQVPDLPPVTPQSPHHGVKHLKTLLQQIPNVRYFWVDVLCINQGSSKEAEKQKKQEIRKQAYIFRSAKWVINYLWTLDETNLSGALSSFGSLLSWCFHFKRDWPPKRYPIVVNDGRSPPEPGPSYKEWDEYFTYIQNEHWFSSLWALQETVLAPAGLWLSRDGVFCSVNGQLLTTCLFAISIRLLWLAYHLREKKWEQVEERYRAAKYVGYRTFQNMKDQFAFRGHEREKALQTALKRQEIERQGYVALVVEADSVSPEQSLPWVIKCRNKERPIAQRIRRWTDWSFGGIDVAPSASRAAILLAGKTREVVDNQSMEQALMAALKVGHHSSFTPPRMQEGEIRHFSTNLLNVILQHDGAKMFNVVHNSVKPSLTVRQDAADLNVDFSEWENLEHEALYMPYLYLQDMAELSAEYPNVDDLTEEDSIWTSVTVRNDRFQNGQCGHDYTSKRCGTHAAPVSIVPTITNMSPCSASTLNYSASQSGFSVDDNMTWVSSKGWHIHDLESLHIPASARIQRIPKKFANRAKLTCQPNGSREAFPVEYLNDEKFMTRYQFQLKGLGTNPQFILLPLGIYTPPNQPILSMLNSRYEVIDKPKIIGVVLVGKGTIQSDASMARFYKFGMYVGKFFGAYQDGQDLQAPDVEGLWRKDGILVTSPADDAALRTTTVSDCRALITSAETIMEKLEDKPTREEGWEVLTGSFSSHDNLSPREDFIEWIQSA